MRERSKYLPNDNDSAFEGASKNRILKRIDCEKRIKFKEVVDSFIFEHSPAWFGEQSREIKAKHAYEVIHEPKKWQTAAGVFSRVTNSY
jgi:hypothetical protein